MTVPLLLGKVTGMTRSNITSPKGPAEWGSKARKADAKARKGNLRRIALRDAVRNG